MVTKVKWGFFGSGVHDCGVYRGFRLVCLRGASQGTQVCVQAFKQWVVWRASVGMVYETRRLVSCGGFKV